MQASEPCPLDTLQRINLAKGCICHADLKVSVCLLTQMRDVTLAWCSFKNRNINNFTLIPLHVFSLRFRLRARLECKKHQGLHGGIITVMVFHFVRSLGKILMQAPVFLCIARQRLGHHVELSSLNKRLSAHQPHPHIF